MTSVRHDFPHFDDPPVPAREWVLDAVRALAPLVRLPANWDGAGSPPITPQAVLTATRLLCALAPELPPLPAVAPVAGGGLQLEWHVADRELEIEMLPGGTIEFLKVEGEQLGEGSLPLSQEDAARDLVRWVLGK